MTNPTVPIEFVRAMARIDLDPMDIGVLLGRCGISTDLLAQDRSRITAGQVSDLVRALWAETGDELFGLGPVPVAHGSTRLIGLGVIHSPDLARAIERFQEFQRLTPGFPQVSLITINGVARITMDTTLLRDPTGVLSLFLLAGLHRIMGWLIGGRIRLHAVELPYAPPAHMAPYGLVFTAPLFFETAVAALEFDTDLLGAPVVQTEASWLDYVDRAPVDILSQREYGVALADRVRNTLARGPGQERALADDVARSLSMSPQTLRRRLALEGTSVTQVRDEILRDEAVTSLVRGEETIEALSLRLGFSEPSAFRRAFRRWTGSPPRAYQHRNHASGDD